MFRNSERGRSLRKIHEVTRKKLRHENSVVAAAYLFYGAKKRAAKKAIPFTITLADVVIPENCPVLGIKLVVGEGRVGRASPTLDKIKPALGYVPGNVHVISHRANTIKSDATIDEIESVARYFRKLA